MKLPITIRERVAMICTISFLAESRASMSSFRPRKKRMVRPTIDKLVRLESTGSSAWGQRKKAIMVEAKIAIPPNVGVSVSCELRNPGFSVRLRSPEILIIIGIDTMERKQAIRKESRH